MSLICRAHHLLIYPKISCMLTRESSKYERSYSLDVLGVEDRGKMIS